ncbi:MAG: UUP1 family membrane protein, partial [Planctomycetales bacterium]|nr:UUP1 family membrane protein [Planctomycetales bacterium]
MLRYRDKLIISILVIACLSIVFWRLSTFDSRVNALLPERHYQFMADMQLQGHGEDIAVALTLPVTARNQRVRDETVKSSSLSFRIESGPNARRGVWSGAQIDNQQNLGYACTVRTVQDRYELDPSLSLPDIYPVDVQPYLLATETIQADAEEIAALYETLIPADQRGNIPGVIRKAYDYCRVSIQPAALTGTTDALTCLHLGEGSCGGKSRLFAALLRHAGIPARLVGGLILKDTAWTASHLWVEAWIAGQWVPFCALNGYFAEKPRQYLVLYYGELPLLERPRDVNFRYSFTSRSILAAPENTAGATGLLNLWGLFEQVHIPIDLLKIMLLFPVGALVVTFTRNMLGVLTFGVFSPALLAVAFQGTGLLWGVFLFLVILAAGTLVRLLLEHVQLLQTPRLGVMVTVTSLTLLAISVFSVAKGLTLSSRVSLFPLVIITMTIERFSVMTEEEGFAAAVRVCIMTILVACFAYGVMNWAVLGSIVLAFPETQFLILALFFIIGRWPGLRLLEYV